MKELFMKNVHIVFCIICVLSAVANATTFTLSDDALKKLDYNYQGSCSVVGITDVAGPGVRFDLRYPDPRNINGQAPYLYLVSCIDGGSGALTGRNISMFDSFALKVTLLSASGVSSPDAVGPVIIGALINYSNYSSAYAYRPEVISINGPDPTSATSITTTSATQIKLVGFVCNIPDWWYSGSPRPNPWDPQGANISLLVEQAPGATVIPEPATICLFAFAGLMLRRKK
jgi:hypothetical protein